MTARKEGWVTVAAAAAALTEVGDVIDPSNVSRYLARFPEIPSVKEGRCRYVDLAELAKHRGANILVGEKRAARDLPDVEEHLEPQPHGGALKRRQLVDDGDEDDLFDAAERSSPVNQANARLKEIAIREKEADWDVRIGKLVPDHEVLTLVSGAMAALIGELERQEGLIAARMGREVAAEFKRCRKAAQAAASAKLIALADEYLKPETAAMVLGTDEQTAAA